MVLPTSLTQVDRSDERNHTDEVEVTRIKQYQSLAWPLAAGKER